MFGPGGATLKASYPLEEAHFLYLYCMYLFVLANQPVNREHLLSPEQTSTASAELHK